MAHQILTADAGWNDTPDYTAGTETEVELINPHGLAVTFITSSDDTKPTLAETHASPLKPKSARAFTLAANERLWVSCPATQSPKSLTLHY